MGIPLDSSFINANLNQINPFYQIPKRELFWLISNK